MAGSSSLSILDLRDEPVIGHHRAPATCVRFAAVDPRPDGSAPIYGPSVDTVEEKLEHVAAGRGVGLVPASIYDHYARNDLSFILVEDIPPSQAAFAWPARAALPLVDAFVSMVGNRVATNYWSRRLRLPRSAATGVPDAECLQCHQRYTSLGSHRPELREAQVSNEQSGNAVTCEHVYDEAARRRTFAVISHPDAGKSTLTEALALHARVLAEAGAVKGRGSRRSVTSDWMAMERQRGISITSAALQFGYRDTVINLLDTPGHADFSEDTYRVLAAVDCAVMLLDSAKGLEPQTLKLFDVCRYRGIPVITFVNKWDRLGREPLELLDEVEQRIGLQPAPITWPVGSGRDFSGVVDRRSDEFVRFTRTAGGATAAPEEVVAPEQAAAEEGASWEQAREEIDLLDTAGTELDTSSFLEGKVTPVFFGSALSNFGVRLLLDALVELAPSPAPRNDVEHRARELDAPFSGLVFKVQANMDPAHRDRIAFIRVCSGRFERGMTVTHDATGRPFGTNYAQQVFGQDRNTVDVAYPGDVVGLVNASVLRVGDTLHVDRPVRFPGIPSFAPEHFAVVRPRDTGRYKQFRRGVAQLDEEGVVQVLRSDVRGEQGPVLAAVGPMQFDVMVQRLEHEFKAPVALDRLAYQLARRTDADGEETLQGVHGVEVLRRNSDRARLALFTDKWRLAAVQRRFPELFLEPLVADRDSAE